MLTKINQSKPFLTLIASLLATLLLATPAIAHSTINEGDKENPPKPTQSLKQIMQQLSQDMQLMTKAIFEENYKQIAVSSFAIAKHPSPHKSEKIKLKALLKEDMKQFKGMDIAVHDSAMSINQAANNADLSTIIQNYNALVNQCQTCHQTFRKKVSTHLNAQ